MDPYKINKLSVCGARLLQGRVKRGSTPQFFRAVDLGAGHYGLTDQFATLQMATDSTARTGHDVILQLGAEPSEDVVAYWWHPSADVWESSAPPAIPGRVFVNILGTLAYGSVFQVRIGKEFMELLCMGAGDFTGVVETDRVVGDTYCHGFLHYVFMEGLPPSALWSSNKIPHTVGADFFGIGTIIDSGDYYVYVSLYKLESDVEAVITSLSPESLEVTAEGTIKEAWMQEVYP